MWTDKHLLTQATYEAAGCDKSGDETLGIKLLIKQYIWFGVATTSPPSLGLQLMCIHMY